ncbi:MAG: UvrD-helicase domain-containing protein, partial [Prevotella sp.]|nr:UvrD-helicase domain-containing protein [Prevotella sp.]
MENILSQLNESQREAVCYNDGPALVIAGAGSGKTRVLTYKIAYLLKQGMNPWNILALTFTNKAAREMQQRVGRLVGEATAARLNMGTFHSVFSHILRVEASSIGYNSQFTIYDETDSRSLLKQIIKSFSLDDKIYKPATVHNRISMAKNNLETASDYKLIKTYQERDRDSKMPAIGAIYEAYDQRLRQANAMDFDDLLMNTYILFRENDDIRRKYAERFQFVLVDEYQDTNYAQQAIVLQLVENHHRLCVVGDDAQSIYAFRGANIDNILDFQKRFPESRLFKLEQNYRSTQRIVEAANSLIKHNKRQIHKDVYSHNDEGEKIVYEAAYSDKEEAIIVSKYIQKIRRQDSCDYSDFAILYRTNAQSRSFEEQLRKDSIPYRIYGGLSFYQRKEIKDVIAYFRLSVNHDDEEAFRRIINYPARGIGNTTVQKIIDCAQQDRVSLWEVVANPLLHGLNISKSTINRLTQFINLISSYTSMLTEKDAYELGLYIVTSSGIAAEVGSSTNPEDLARKENLDEFLSGMQEFAETAREEDRQQEAYLPNFLQEVALLTDLDSKDDATSRVSLMTVHAAKGLEFPTV